VRSRRRGEKPSNLQTFKPSNNLRRKEGEQKIKSKIKMLEN
jgi:hypothetical protein